MGWQHGYVGKSSPARVSLSVLSRAQAKELLEEAGFEKNSQAVVLGGALIAGFFASACSLPFDFVKTRIQVGRHRLRPYRLATSPTSCRPGGRCLPSGWLLLYSSHVTDVLAGSS